MSLIARHLEENGLPTVVMGCARDIVEHAGVPRFLWSDFPLGNSAGKPGDVASQTSTLSQALALFETATGPHTTEASPQRWSDDEAWQHNFMNVDALTEAQVDKLKADFQDQKNTANKLKSKTSVG